MRKDKRTPNAITKLLDFEHAEDEYKVVKLLKGINAYQKYFLYPMSKCFINESKLDPATNNIDSCSLAFANIYQRTGKLPTAEGIEYAYGGNDLTNIKLHPSEFINFFTGFLKIFEALELLHKNNIVHLDIKTGNLVTKKLPDNTWDFHVIDFGFTIKTNDNIRIKELPIDSDYVIWPYDIKFAISGWNKRNISEKSVASFLQTLSRSYIKMVVPQNVYDTMKSLSQKDYIYLYETMITKYRPAELIDLVLKEADVYSLGIVLIELYAKLLGHTNRFDKTTDTYFPLFMYESRGISEIKYKWHETVSREISIPLFELVERMTAPNVIYRITMEGARIEYTRILENMKRLFTKDQVIRYLGKYALEPNPPYISNVPPANITEHIGINVNNRMLLNNNFSNALSSAESAVEPAPSMYAASNRKLLVPAGPVRKPPPVADFSGRPPPMNALNTKIAELVRQKGKRSLASMPLAELMPAKTRKNRKHRKE